MPVDKLGVKALNDHTLQVDLEYPMPYFNRMMIMPAFFPQSRAALKKLVINMGQIRAKCTMMVHLKQTIGPVVICLGVWIETRSTMILSQFI